MNAAGSALKLGFIGVGKMGAPIARRLIDHGHHVILYDVAQAAMRPLLDAGRHSAASARDVASQAGLVFTCLPSLQAVREVALGANGLCQGTAIEALIDCSTTGPGALTTARIRSARIRVITRKAIRPAIVASGSRHRRRSCRNPDRSASGRR